MSAVSKLAGVPETANEILMQRAIRHHLLVQGVGNREAANIRRLLKRASVDVQGQLERRLALIAERGWDLGPVTTQRLQEMAAGLREISAPVLRQAQQNLEGSLNNLAQSEAELQAGLLRHVVPLQVEVVMPSVPMLRSVVAARPFDGKLLGEWFDELGRRQQAGVVRAVRLGMVEGETIPQISRRLRDEVGELTRRQAEAVARTAVNHVSTHAREATYAANSEVVSGVSWLSTLDASTCYECQALDGQEFQVDQGPRPPRHWNCRCTTTPTLASWKDLGIAAKELPESTRASMDGQVPESLTYNTWLRGRVNVGDMDTVTEALGVNRGKLFAAGGLQVEQFVDRAGRMLTLHDLRQRESDVFEQLNIDPRWTRPRPASPAP